jgi:hypothetical protein
MKIRPVGVELFHADGRMYGWTDRHRDGRTDKRNKANSHFYNFVKAPKNITPI